ncbi:VgrG-related protein [Nocardioides sp. WS12]|uniref:VgrG-related protein n=1 Tax=Nocardioides sp. WS12 TaxID=2486272 RepID=UPI0015F91DDD|nr:VgrG-related protein [Nocardioides sp. WS12]
MPHGEEFSNTLLVKVNGTSLPSDIATQMVSGLIDESTRVPDLFVLRFRDPDGTVLAKGHFEIGAKVELTLQNTAPGGPEPLHVGEVTALEVEIGEAGLHTVVRGLDVAHRLYRGTRVLAFLNMTASDIVRKVAGTAGVQVQQIDPTTAMLEHTTQAGECDWDFLSRLATEHDRMLTVTAGKLHFIERPEAAGAPSGTDSRSDQLVLQQGVNLVDLRATITASGQVKDVNVRGWDPATKAAVIATKPCATPSAQTEVGITPAKIASAFPSPSYVVGDARLANQDVATASAASLADHVAGGFAEVEGIAKGNPALRAGSAVKLAGVGAPFVGRYVLTSTRHDFRPATGYRTHFTASNTSERSLYGTLQDSPANDPRIVGVVPAVVTNAKDPQNQGRVKVKVPWLSDDYESGWCRTVHAGAGSKRGLVILPEVDDEVLISFAHGDLGHPYVLGGVFNGKDLPKQAWSGQVDGSNGEITTRAWVSRTGMQVVFLEKAGAESLEISTNNGAQKVLLEQTTKGIKIISEGPTELTAKQDVTVKSNTTVKVEGINVEITGSAGVKIKGATVEIEASGPLKLKGAVTQVEASGPLTVQGAIVKIN